MPIRRKCPDLRSTSDTAVQIFPMACCSGRMRPADSPAVWCVALLVFALSNSYLLSMAVLFVAGFAELAFNAMAQTLVQMNAPDEIRGGVIGVFSMSALGLRTFSGLSVGLLGAALGIHHSLALSAAALVAIYAALYVVRRRSR